MLQQLHAALLLSGVVVEHALDVVARHKHLLGEDVQQLVVDGQVPLHPELRHLLQGSVDELHVTPPAHVLLAEDLEDPGERGLGSGVPGRPFKQVLVGDQGLACAGVRRLPLLVGALRGGGRFGVWTSCAGVEASGGQARRALKK